MKLIKLDAIDSTNDFLKGLSNKQIVENFTIVTTDNQTKGKGQMGSVWVSESGMNLIMSVLVKYFLRDVDQIYNLNIAVSLAVIEVLESLNIPDLSIKWPNDIMSDNKKLGGILIENSLKSDGTILSVVGLGLNVNQINFENLPKASSLALICQKQFDKEKLLLEIVAKLKEILELWKSNCNLFWEAYSDRLFKKGIPMPFVDSNKVSFMGIIQGVAENGRLLILLEDDQIVAFDIKEIQMLY